MADHGEGLDVLVDGGELGQERVDVLVVEGLVHVDAAGVDRLGHHTRGLQRANRGAAPDGDLRVLAQKLERAGIRDLKGANSRRRELAVDVVARRAHVLGLSVTHEHQCLYHAIPLWLVY